MKDNRALALEAYTYTFPLVFNLQQILRYLEVGMEGVGAGTNAFSHARRLSGVHDKFVSVNNDTIYSWAGINLTGGPLVLDVPASPDRFYGGQIIDAWTNNIAYVGSRGTEGKAERVYLVPPHYTGDIPSDGRQIRFSTDVGVVLMRYAIDGVEDLPNVIALQEQTILAPLPGNTEVTLIKTFDTTDPLAYFRQAVNYLTDYPASARDKELFESKYAVLGLNDPAAFEAISDDVRELLIDVGQNGVKHLQTLMAAGKEKNAYVNGWDMSLHAFDYNDEYFEIGARGEAEYVIADRDVAMTTRALSAIGALWGNNAYEAAYFFLWEDSEGNSLTGDNTYEITFNPLPPVNAFWSLTMYDLPEFFLVDNEINRYSLGDRTRGIVYNEDGSITLTLGNTKPSDPKRLANWLPAPVGQFRPIMRMYLPKDEVFVPGFALPTAKKI